MQDAQVDSEDGMQDVVLEVNEEHSIVVSIPVEKVDEYRNKIETDSEFKKKEIESALVATKTGYGTEGTDICNRTIKAVRYTIVQNPGEYPKVWRVFERIS